MSLFDDFWKCIDHVEPMRNGRRRLPKIEIDMIIPCVLVLAHALFVRVVFDDVVDVVVLLLLLATVIDAVVLLLVLATVIDVVFGEFVLVDTSVADTVVILVIDTAVTCVVSFEASSIPTSIQIITIISMFK